MRIMSLIVFTLVSFSFQFASAQQEQSIYITKTVEGSFEEICMSVKEVLKEQGFGVITEIDMDEKLKEKLDDVELRPYKILGVCNPAYAYETLKIEENIGVFLPCKAIIRDLGDNRSEVVMMNPSSLMGIMGKPELDKIAAEVTQKFQLAIGKL